MARNYCAVIPSVKNSAGESVNSKLFTDLLALTRGNRKKTIQIYAKALKSKSKFRLDEFGEPTVESIRELWVDGSVSPINTYAADKNITAKELQMLKVHREIVNKIATLKGEIKLLKRDYSKYKDSQYKAGTYSSEDPILKEMSGKWEIKEAETNKLRDSLPDLDGGKLLDKISDYNELSNVLMDQIEAKTTYDLNNPDDINELSKNYRLLQAIISTKEPSWAARAIKLEDGLVDYIGDYIKMLTPQLNLEGTDFKELTVEILQQESKDVNFIEYLFNGFGDYPRLEAQLIHSRVLKGKAVARTRTIQKTQELLDKMANLQAWAKKNIKKGNKMQGAYDLLIAVDNKNRLSLVKPFTNQYYKDLSKAYADYYSGTKEGREAGKNWLNAYKNKPNTQYANAKYQRVMAIPELKDFYEFFKTTVAEQYELLPPWIENTNEEKLPTLFKNVTFSFVDLIRSVKDKGVRQTLWDGLRGIIFGDGTVELYGKDGEVIDKVRHKELVEDEIKLRMLREIDANKKSTDLGKVLHEFIAFTNQYSEMEKALPEVRLIETLVNTKTYSNDFNKFLGKDANMHAAIRRYIDAKVVGNTSQKYGKIDFLTSFVEDENGNVIGERTYAFTDFIKQLMSYTRSLYLGFNPFSATNNVTIGLFGDLIEASGGEYFNKRDLLKAVKIYWSERFNPESKFNKLIDYIQPLQELGEYEERDSVELQKTRIDKIWNERFFLQEKGEDFIQSIPMIAYMLNRKENGQSLWDLFYIKDGEVKFNSKEAGFKLDQNKLNDYRETIKYVNRQIHGNYSQDNSSVFAPSVFFQAAVLFKKWVPQAMQQRLQARRYNYITGKVSEGRLRTLFNVLLAEGGFYRYPAMFIKDVLSINLRLQDPRPLESYEKANIRKAFTESLLFLGLTLLLKMLAPPPDEDDFVWLKPDWYEEMSMFEDKQEYNEWRGIPSSLYKSMLEQVTRAQSDVANLYTPTFYIEAFTTHIFQALGKSIERLYTTLFLEISEGDFDQKGSYYQRGNRKGERKDLNQTLDLIPVVRQVNKARAASAAEVTNLQK